MRLFLTGIGLFLAAQVLVWAVIAPRRVAASPAVAAGVEAVTPGELTGTLLLGGFRGLACDLLWMRADGAKEAGRFYESVALFEGISRIQPRFEQPWQYMAWDLAYNLSHEVDDRRAKWAWILAGIKTGVRGCERNPQSIRLLTHLAWIFHHKGDLFHEEIEGVSWAGLLNPLLERVNRQSGSAHQVPLIPEGPGRGNFVIAAHLYGACVALGDGRDGGALRAQFIRRMIPLGLESDGNLQRNRGLHLVAFRRYLESLRAWEPVIAWATRAPRDDTESNQRRVARESYERNEGRLRRKAAALATALAPADLAESVSAALLARQWSTVDEALKRGGWTETKRAGHIRWLDE